MRYFITILMACLAISTFNVKEASARCDVLPARAKAPVWSQNGGKVVLIVNHGKKAVVYIKNKGGSSLEDCYPKNLKYDKTKLICTVVTSQKDLARYELESNHRIFCESKVNHDTKSTLSFDAQGSKEVKVWSFQSDSTLLEVYRRLAGKVKDLEDRVDNTEKTANDAHEIAIKAKRETSRAALEIEGFLSPVTQGMSIKDWPAGGVGVGFRYFFFNREKIKVGALVGLRWQRMMLTIDGAPDDMDVPGDQYDLLFNLAIRWKPFGWLSLDLNGGLLWDFFHHQDHIADTDPEVAGPNGNISQSVGLNLGGGINFHIGRFFIGPHIMGALIFHGLYHPNFEGEARFGLVKHFYVQILAGVTF